MNALTMYVTLPVVRMNEVHRRLTIDVTPTRTDARLDFRIESHRHDMVVTEREESVMLSLVLDVVAKLGPILDAGLSAANDDSYRRGMRAHGEAGHSGGFRTCSEPPCVEWRSGWRR